MTNASFRSFWRAGGGAIWWNEQEGTRRLVLADQRGLTRATTIHQSTVTRQRLISRDRGVKTRAERFDGAISKEISYRLAQVRDREGL
jgi:hypothetical protein